MKSIESTVRSEVQSFVHNPITVVQGYEFNQYENVKKTHLYLNSRFYSGRNTSTESPLVDYETGEDDDDDRIFFNITVPRVRATKRFFDVDVADIVLDEIDPKSEKAIQLLNKDFDRFAEKHNLAEELNEFVNPYIEYGSLVVKVHDNAKPEIIPLQDYFVDPTVERSKDSRFNIIRHTMTPQELREKVADGWDADAVEEVIREAKTRSNAENSYVDDGGTNRVGTSPIIYVFERYGYMERYLIDESVSEESEEGQEEIFALTITAHDTDCMKKGQTDTKADGVLFKEEWTMDLPIEDTHLVKTHGRWQGIGVVEVLYPIQKRMNEVANQKRLSMEISALHLFQTADPTVLNNILTDLENGDIIKTKVQGALQPVVNEERNLPAFESEIVNYSSQGDKLTFANDLISGGDIASSTPATNVVVQNNNQVLVHLQSRENFTNFIANQYVKRHVVPELIEEMSDEHYLRMASEPEDILQLEEEIVDMNVWEITKKRALEKGSVVDVFLKEELKDKVRRKLKTTGINRYVKVLQNYYKDKIGDILVLIGNEKKDVARIANNTLQFFQLMQDPAMLDDPVNRVFVKNYGREIGIDTAQLELAFAKREAMQVPEAQGQLPTPGEGPVEAKAEAEKDKFGLAEVGVG